MKKWTEAEALDYLFICGAEKTGAKTIFKKDGWNGLKACSAMDYLSKLDYKFEMKRASEFKKNKKTTKASNTGDPIAGICILASKTEFRKEYVSMSHHKFAILKDSIESRTKHYIGFPPEIIGVKNEAKLLKRAKVLIAFDTLTNGYELYRYDKSGEFAGDTWHETEDAVTEQVKFEFNLKDIYWRNIPQGIDDPIKYAIEYMKSINEK